MKQEDLIIGDKKEIASIIRGEMYKLLPEAIQAALIQFEDKQKSKKFFTRSETADRLHITLPTLREREKDGTLVPTRIGRRVLYSEDSINSFLNSSNH